MGLAVIFPGQGTQQPGMGRIWRDHAAWEIVDRAEAATGEALSDLLLDASAERLARTREAQLVVLLTSLMAWESIRELVVEPVAFAGHSLGQVSALIAAGVLDLESGIELAARRAELTQEAADRRPGRMVALLGATPEQAAAACAAVGDGCWVANDNAPGQVVIAGTPEGVEAGTEQAKALGVRRATALNVGAAFHTPLMQEAAEGLVSVLAGTTLRTPAAPVVSNLDARPYEDAEGWRDRSARHVATTVRWRESMLTMVELGATSFLEVGAGAMLAGLAKRTVPELPVHHVGSPADVAAFETELSEVAR